MRKCFKTAAGAALIVLAQAVTFGNGVSIHTTNGAFDASEWTFGSSLEVNVTKTFFPNVGQKGGAYLYVGQGVGTQANKFYLMSDYVRNTNAVTSQSFFDLLFQVPYLNKDFGAHITQAGLSVFEKPAGTLSQLNADGSLKFSASPWVAAPGGDLTLGQFQGAIGFGPSPDLATSHQLAEFELTINTTRFIPPGATNGLLDPASSFWSVSNKGFGVGDPPISSAIFQLNPNGTTTVNPVFGADGGPVLQPQDVVVPAPAAVWGGVGLMGVMAAMGLRRQRHSEPE